MILATLTIKANVEKSKVNSAKKLPPVGTGPGVIGLLFRHILCYTLYLANWISFKGGVFNFTFIGAPSDFWT